MKLDVTSLIGLANKAEEMIAKAGSVLDKVQELKSAGEQLIDRVQSFKAGNNSEVNGIAPETEIPDEVDVAEVDVAEVDIAEVDIVEIDADDTEITSESSGGDAVASEMLISKIESVATLTTGAQVTMALEAVNKITEEVGATIRYCEEQQTRREEIVQAANVRITQINRTTELIKVYLEKTFDERGQLFDNYFGVLDRAMANGDLELMSQTLAAINSLAVSSPFKNLADINSVAKGLSEGTEWDI